MSAGTSVPALKPLLDLVHAVKQLLMLHPYVHADGLAFFFQLALEGGEVDGGGGEVDQHYHGEVVLHEGLGDVADVHAVLFHDDGDVGDDADLVFSENGDYCFHVYVSLC